MLNGEFLFDDLIINTYDNQLIKLRTKKEVLKTPANERQIFTNSTGECVIELSGLTAPDQRTDISWAYAFYDKDGYSELHYHNERTETYFVINGTAKVIINGIEYILHKMGKDNNTYKITPPGI